MIYKRTLYSVLAWTISIASTGQLKYVINEAYHTGSPLPDDYTCYRIYAILEDSLDELSQVFALPDHPISWLSTNTNPIWNHILGGVDANGQSCFAISIFPEAEFDSFLTIGRVHCNCANCEIYPPGRDIENDDFLTGYFGNEMENSFHPTGDFVIYGVPYETTTDLLFAMTGSCNSKPQPPDNRVLIAQATVPTGTLAYYLNIEVRNDGNPTDILGYYNCLNADYPPAGNNQCYVCNGLYWPSWLLDQSLPSWEADCLICTDPLACNFTPYNNNGFEYCDYGQCTDPEACNYFPYTDCSDISLCTFPGCTDPLACNYNESSGCEDGSCIYELTGDFDCNGMVDVLDLLIFSASYGCFHECGAADLNDDGVVSLTDLLIFLPQL